MYRYVFSQGRLAAAGAAIGVLTVLVGAGRPPLSAQSTTLVQQSHLQYEGAFRLPGGTFGASNFGYSGTAMAHNPAKNSLYVVGHDWEQAVAEISIPAIRNSTRVADLATATVLQPFVEPTEGLRSQVSDGTVKVGGLMVYGGQLYGTVFMYYDGSGGATKSHFVRPLNLSTRGQVRGMYQVGTNGAGWTAGYMVPTPAEWQAALGSPTLTGQCCLPIISRTSAGPAAYGFNPSDLGTKNPVPVTGLLYYPLDRPLAPETTQNQYFNLSTEVGGMVFPSGGRSVLFFGRHGTGPYCYGDGTQCNDPTSGSKGTHAYPYEYQVWAYDVQDLIAVKNNQKNAYDVRPYGVWHLNLPFSDDARQIKGVAYDQSTQRIFLSTAFTDGEQPLIQVYKLNLTAGPVMTAPAPPTNVRVTR